MSKEINKLIPDLRFPEFVNEGEWTEITIESVGDVVTGGTPSKEEDEYWGGDFVWVTAQDFKEKYIYDSVLKLTKKGKGKSRVIPKNSVLVTCIASIGLNGINKVECATNQQINSIVCNSLNHYEFVYYAISKNNTRLKNMAGQTAVPIISKSIFEKFTIQKPQKPEEQQKIAACLSSLDEVITAHSQKLDLLKDHKKGLMQNLFPQDGEKVPKLRFNEFVNDGEWKEKPLGSLSNLISEKAGTKKYKLLSVTAGIGFVSQIEKFGREIAGDSYKNYFVIRKGDFAYNKSSVKIHPEGQIALLENDDFGAVPNSIFTCFRVDKNIIFPGFLKYPFENNIHGKWLRKFIAVGARANGALNVDNKDLLALPIKFPSIAEQQKIASCLSSLDDLIKSQTEKVEQLKLHKKGLMQGLFPKINE